MNYNEYSFDTQHYYDARPQRAADFRKRAKRALKGFWWKAMLVTLIASFFGGIATGGMSYSFNFGSPAYTEDEFEEDIVTDTPEEIEEIVLTREEAKEMEAALAAGDFTVLSKLSAGESEEDEMFTFILSFLGIIFAVCMVAGIALNLFVTSPIQVGYQRFQLSVIDGRTSDIRVGTLFRYFSSGYGKSIALNFCHSFILNLTLLPMYAGMVFGGMELIKSIPWLYTDDVTAFAIGILSFVGFTLLGSLVSMLISLPVSYAYSMAHIIMADYPGMGAIACLRASRRMMRGNKWRLFCLDFSFIGWALLGCCIPVIGPAMVIAYNSAARAAFYDEISDRQVPADVEFPSLDFDDYVID